MKKILKIMAVLTCLILAITGCSGKNSVPSETANKDDALKIILLIPGNLGDKSFFDSANQGIELIKSELNATTKVIEMGTDSTKWEPSFIDASEGDWDIIISGNDTIEMMNTIAKEYPDKKYINFDTFVEDTSPNVYSMFYKTNEVSYLAGALAALITESDMPLANDEKLIGFLGGMDIPGINDFLVGYIQGASFVNPDIKVLVSYAGDFGDPAKGKEIGIVQYSSGVDISFNVAGGTGLGLIDAANDQNAYAIGVDSDQAMLFKDASPEKAEHILSSAVKRIDQAMLSAVKKHIQGELEYGTHNKIGIKEGAVGLAKNEYYAALPENIKNKITEIETKVKNGEITVDSAFGNTTDFVEDLRKSVRP